MKRNNTYSIVLFTVALLILFVWFDPFNKKISNIPNVPTTAGDVNSFSVSDTQIPVSQACTTIHQVDFCIKKVINSKDGTLVVLEITPPAGVLPEGTGFMLPALGESISLPVLMDEQNNEYKVIDTDRSFIALSDDEGQTYSQTLKFPPLNENVNLVTLKFSFIKTFTPLESDIQLNLGENFQPGETIPLDQMLDVPGYGIHLVRAELVDSGTGFMQMDIWSDPVTLENDTVALALQLGSTEKWNIPNFTSKWITSDTPYHAFTNIPSANQLKLAGTINIPVEGMATYYQGEFEINFSISDFE